MTANLDYMKLEVTEPSALAWVDITADMQSEHTWSRCNMGHETLDRIAKVGRFSFSLNNSNTNINSEAGYYSKAASLWLGAGVRLTYCYDGIEKVVWIGVIREIDIDMGTYGDRKVYITAYDLMEELEKQFTTTTYQTDKNVNQVVQSVLDSLTIFTHGDYTFTGTSTPDKTFATVFDTVSNKSTGIEEISKAVLSEFGHLVFRMDRNVGQVLQVQSLLDRQGSTARQIPAPSDIGDLLELTNGNTLLLTNGNELALRTQIDTEITNVNNGNVSVFPVINTVRITVNPRTIGTSVIVLASIAKPILLDQAGGPKESTTIILPFKDPDEVAQYVAGFDCVTPVATTDYTSNTQEDGGGSDQTAKLTVEVIEFRSNEVELELTNTHTADVYVTLCNVRGKMISTYSPYDVKRQTESSVLAWGVVEVAFSMAYFQSYDDAEEMADRIMDIESVKPVNTVKNVDYYANRSSTDMMRMLFLEPGDVIHVEDTQSDIDQDLAIQGIQVQASGNALYINYALKTLEATS